MDMRARTLPQGEPILVEGDDWYMDAIIYQLHVKAFHDSNDDGIGDFAGLTAKLDYIRDLGVNTVWLLPFYPSPQRDDGYDVADYRHVHPAYGTLPDFKNFVREAHRRGLRVITELVVNHTSDAHAWFQAARRAPKGSPKRDYYVWSDDPNKYAGTRIIFTDTETSNWAWDEVAQQHYWHRFFSHQPDLNFDNPHVVKSVIRVMRYWLDMGVDGFRLDAIPYLCEREGTNNENLPETHAVIKQIRAALDERHPGKLLLAEANQWPEDVREYFGDGDECHMAYHFPLMPRLYLSIAMEDRHPLLEILGQTPPIPAGCQWAIFLRNHDELTLEMVTDRERDYLYGVFASDPRMRVNVGIRRRLAPLMENDRERIELISFLLMTLPGSPILYYGDEIGMGDNIYLGDRNGVRTPMQWSPDRNAGFSRGDPQRLYLPPIMDPVYGYEAVNVEAQSRSPSSLLNWTRRLIAMRRRHRAFSRGTLAFLEPGNRKILAFLREHEGESMLCVANLSAVPQAVELDLGRFESHVPVEVMGGEAFPPIGKLPYMLTLPGRGYLAFRLARDARPPAWHLDTLPYRRLPVLVLEPDWEKAFDQARETLDLTPAFMDLPHEKLRDEVLLPWLRTRRWFASKNDAVRDVRLAAIDTWKSSAGTWYLAFLRVELESGPPQEYFLPLAIAWETREEDPADKLGAYGIAKVRRKDRVGLLYGAVGNPEFARALARGMASGGAQGAPERLRFSATAALMPLAASIDADVRIATLDQSNTGVFLGHDLYLKNYRRLQPGTNPELEVGRFLTEASPYDRIAPVVGAVELLGAPGEKEPRTLVLLQKRVENQGDLWTLTLANLGRMLTIDPAATSPIPAAGAGLLPTDMRLGLLGRRLAELHAAFAKTTGDADFDPEPVVPADLRGWRDAVVQEAGLTFDALARALERLPADLQRDARELLGARGEFLRKVLALPLPAEGLAKTRYHGDFHLGQVLIAQDDFVLVDFEGEPARTLEERRRKHSPLRDVAGLLRSIDYASHAASRQAGALAPSTVDPVEMLSTWCAQAARAFLSGYREAAASVASIPQDDAGFRALLDLFVAEKALYELRYEMNQRPDWVAIPLKGLAAWIRA